MKDHQGPRAVAGTRRRPYVPPSVVHAEELTFETRLQCVSVKTAPCSPFGCSVIQAS